MKHLVTIMLILHGFISIAQNDTLNVHFSVLKDSIGVFDVWNQEDTSYIVGKVRFVGDTIYFKELESFYLKLNRAHGANTTTFNSDVSLSKHAGHLASIVEPNTIATRFHFLGKSSSLLHFDTFTYTFDEDLLTTYNSVAQNDTLHYIPYQPEHYGYLELSSPFFDTKGIPMSYSGQFAQRRRKKDQGILDFWLIDLDAYGSIRKFEIDLNKLVGDTVTLGQKEYTIRID